MKIYIGIDPDTDRSGVAIFSNNVMQCAALAFADMVGLILQMHKEAEQQGDELIVVVEAGWLNKSNWHVTGKDNAFLAAMKGLAVGRNQQVGKCLVELLRAENVQVIEQKPLRKVWRKGKISHDELAKLVKLNQKRTNQEMRDAALLAYNESKKRF